MTVRRDAGGSHAARWGVVYLLVTLFAASWCGQLVAELPKISQEGWSEFWAATFQNWQSEFLQLAFEAGIVTAAARRVFRASIDDAVRLESKIDELLRRDR